MPTVTAVNSTQDAIVTAKSIATLGTRVPDGLLTSKRGNGYGEQYVQNVSSKNYVMVEDGSLFMSATPTAGTGVALGVAAATAIVATAPSILIVNNDAAGGKSIILDSIKLIATGAGTALTRLDAAFFADTTNRYSSGGTPATPQSNNMLISPTSIAKFYDASSAIVATAASSGVRRVGRNVLRTAIPVVGDQYIIDFGGFNAQDGGITNGTAALNIRLVNSACVIGPQQSFLMYLWGASQSAAPTYEYEITWAER